MSEASIRFYAPSNVDRIRDIESNAPDDLASIADAVQRDFSEQYREELAACGRLADRTVASNELQELIAEEYEHWLDGTYGLCTKHATVNEIVLKGVSIDRIRRLTEDGTRAALSPEDLNALREALAILDRVASCFAPDELKTSSRETWFNAINSRYGLCGQVQHPEDAESVRG
ncbi:MAG: DUF6058 family natural product biosynthesis protein [Planctomycetota bacterium]|nr:DUF6058 family natural product biosynthesis protein [Planctomycetota bacterium]